MSHIVLVEVQSVDSTACFPVFQHAFGTVSEWDYGYAFAADGYLGGQFVHLGIARSLWQDVLSDPGVEDARSVDA